MSDNGLGWFFRLLRHERDVKAIAPGRIGQRIWNRMASKMLRRADRTLYR
jgi:hypothetical protein